METITDKQVKEAQKFFNEACERCTCVFAQGYIGIKNRKSGDLPICGRSDGKSNDGRLNLLQAVEQGYCSIAAIVANAKTGKGVYLDGVRISSRGAELQESTWAGITDVSGSTEYVADVVEGPKPPGRECKVANLRRRGNIFTRIFMR